jgi:hypothetical protein
MNRPPKSSAKKTPAAHTHASGKAPDHLARIKNQKIDNSRLAARARGNGSARGK